jgi:hypothetical protein
VNIAIINQGALSGVILVLFWYCFGYIIFSPFLAKIFMFCILFYIWNTTLNLPKENFQMPNISMEICSTFFGNYLEDVEQHFFRFQCACEILQSH